MPISLTSGGATPTTVTAQQFASELNSQWPNKRINDTAYPGNDIGDQWLNYYNKNQSKSSLATLEKAFLDIVALEDLRGGLKESLNAVGNAQSQVVTGAVAGAIQVFKWTDLTFSQLFVRIGEILLGLVLLGVGVAKMTNAVPLATKVAKYVK